MSILEASHLRRVFGRDQSFVAVDDVSFAIEAGEILALLGPNGAGKTTIVQMVGGYLAPTSGYVLYNGRKRSEILRQKQIVCGVVFGGEMGFYGRATALDI